MQSTGRLPVKPLLALLAIALLSIGAAACGDAGSGSGARTSSGATVAKNSSSAEAARIHASDDDDADDLRNYETRGEREDDREVTTYGHAANATDIRTATAFARRYFAAAAAANGAAACSLLLPHIAKLVPKAYGNEPNLPYMRGKTCAEVMTKLFEHRHKMMAAEAAGLEVTGMRIAGKAAAVLLAFKGLRERRYLGVERTGKTWRLEDLIDSEFP